MAAANRQGKMQNLINYRMRVTLMDGRQMAGQMLAFDKHMNLVIADTEEFRRTKKKAGKAAPGSSGAQTLETEERRSIGLTIIRGSNIVSLSVDGPPPADQSARLGTSAPGGVSTGPAVMASGPGVSRPAGRGLPVGLTGPQAGVGGPGPGAFGGFAPPSGGFAPPPGFGGRGAPPPGFAPPGFPAGGPPPGFQPPFPGPPGGRGYPPPGFGGR
ncbi:Sm-like ribonucleoprotein [Delitschia confertaspora ATCC 74209]|uniref:Sm protein B n=1 Tax=Delitschia confertaspora ATCC 74209 TaxID=1513339 RepID=A0A9P4JID0_9PLEO|nr:Sm-like ribonucleoprotein [Delitschia confertaspora ATCC 74209]